MHESIDAAFFTHIWTKIHALSYARSRDVHSSSLGQHRFQEGEARYRSKDLKKGIKILRREFRIRNQDSKDVKRVCCRSKDIEHEELVGATRLLLTLGRISKTKARFFHTEF